MNILPSNVVFIDDNPLEIEEVRRAFPEIRTLSIPQQRWRNVLLHAPQLQTSTLTEESQNRTTLLKAKVERDKIAADMDRDEYLRSLKLQVRITEIRDNKHTYFARTLELLNKTNQFNTTGQRWSEADMVAFLAQSGSVIYTASVEDRLANHGLTAIAIVSGAEILQFVLSCRIFGLGIETALLHKLMTSMQLKDCDAITAYSKDTGRNASSRNFYLDHQFILQDDDGDGVQKWLGSDIPAEPSWVQIVDNQL